MTKAESKEFNKRLFGLLLPMAFQQFMVALVSASDALMLGRLTQDAMSAVSLAGQVTFVESLVISAMVTGLSIFAAQYWGKGDITSVEKVFAYVMKITVAFAACFFLAALTVPGVLMNIFTNNTAIHDYGVTYLRVVAPSFLFVAISQIFVTILKNSNRVGKASLICSACVVINICLNAVLIFGLFGFPKLGVAGAALATVIARLVELAWCAWEIFKHKTVALRLTYICHDDKLLRGDFWKYTSPVLGNSIAWGTGFAMSSVIMGHMGSDAVAANSVALVVKNLVVCFSYGIGGGGSIIVGNALGAGKLSEAKEYGGRICRVALIFGIICGAFLVAIRPLVISVAGLTDQGSYYLNYMMCMCAIYLIGKYVNGSTIAGFFSVGGDSRFGFICDTVTLWLIVVPLGLLAAFVWKWPVLVVYAIINMDEIIKLPAVYINYKKFKWVKDLTRNTQAE